MEKTQTSIALHPWIIAEKQQYNNDVCYSISTLSGRAESVILISIINIKPQLFNLIGCLQIPQQPTNQQSTTLVYLSDSFEIQTIIYQIAYIPIRQIKKYNQFVTCLTDILKQISSVVISDVNFSGTNSFKNRCGPFFGQTKQFVLVNGKQLYGMNFNQNKIQLLNKLEPICNNQLLHSELLKINHKHINFNVFQSIFASYLKQFHLFVNSQKNCTVLTATTLQHYRLQQIIKDKHNEMTQIFKNKGMLSFKQLQLLQTSISQSNNVIHPHSEVITQIAIKSIMKEIYKENNNNLINRLRTMKQLFNGLTFISESDLQVAKIAVQRQLKDYNIPIELMACVTHQTQLNRLEQIIANCSDQKIQVLQQIKVKNETIEQLQNQKKYLQIRIDHLIATTNRLSQVDAQLFKIKEQLDDQQSKNKQLQLKIDSHIYVDNKNAEILKDIQNKIQTINKQKNCLLVGIQQLTQENLSLLGQKEHQKIEINQLKERVIQFQQIEARALLSIQNQAEIKVRLNRYQNYVKQLKQSIKSYKKMEIQKFNYILQANYKQHQITEQQYQMTQLQLLRANLKTKQLQQTLRIQRQRLNYFQKIVLNSLQTQTIPEVSEQTSATDRQIEQFPQMA